MNVLSQVLGGMHRAPGVFRTNIGRWVLAAWLCWGGGNTWAAAASSIVASNGSRFIVGHWGTLEGLPQSSVFAITQTRDGYLWLGTYGGLARFDGIHFTVFNEENTPGLRSRRVVCLFEDSQSRLWIGTETEGVVYLKDGQLKRFDLGRGGAQSRLASVCEDEFGAVWLLTAGGRLCRTLRDRADEWNMEPVEGRFSNCRVVTAEKSGLVWVASDSRITGIRPARDIAPDRLPAEQDLVATGATVKYLLASKERGYWRIANFRIQKVVGDQIERDLGAYPWGTNSAVQVNTACEDLEGNLVVGTSAGVYWYDSEGQASLLTTKEGLSYDWVRSLFMDRDGNLWVGTDGGGLNCVKRHPFRVVRGTESQVVQSVCEGTNHDLWVGVNFGLVTRLQQGELTNFVMSTANWTALNLPVRSVFVDRGNRVWGGVGGDAGMASGLYLLKGGQFLRCLAPAAVLQPVQSIHQDRNGTLWIGSQGGLVRWEEPTPKVFTRQDGLAADDVRALADDAEGNLWVGTHGGGLSRLRDGRWESFHKQDSGLPSDDISSLHVDGDGVLWVGTSLRGLARYQGGKWTRFTKEHGLASDLIHYLLEDRQGFLWAGTAAGLMRMRKSELNEFAAGHLDLIACRMFSTADGLPAPECTQGSQPAACQLHDGRLLFPTTRGLVSLDPEHLKLNPTPPPVVIESVLVDGKRQGSEALGAIVPQSVEVPPGQEQIEIRFASLNIGSAERTRFRYRLEPHETGWNEGIQNVRMAQYRKLPPKEYRFQVVACNEDGVWNEAGATLLVTVLPHFWQTWWFTAGSSLVLLGTIVGIVRSVATRKLQRRVERMEQQEALERERKRIARDLHDQLGASLTQVSLLGELVESDKDAPAEVEAHGKQIAQTARETTRVLDEIVWAVNPSNDTLEGLINYICKHAQDYFAMAGVRYRLEVPAQLPAVEIPPEVRHNVFLASKEAITNVIRHAKATAAWIRLRIDANYFVLEIEDNGRGLSELDGQKGRNGLRNMRKRMEDIGGEFLLTPGAEGGARVRLVVPIGKE